MQVKQWDVIVVGGGIIGLSLAIALDKRGLKPLIVERGEPGREATHAAGGMLAAADVEPHSPLLPLAQASAALYPEFVHELQDESGLNVDLRDQGTIVLHPADAQRRCAVEPSRPLGELEPGLSLGQADAIFLRERSVDPRLLAAAALAAVNHRGIDMVSGSEVIEVSRSAGSLTVRTAHTTYTAGLVVNCAGSWAGQIPTLSLPVRPVKGQMLSIVGAPSALRHVIRSPEAYLIPRSDGKVVVGATLEEAGYDKRTDPDTIKRMFAAAVNLVPALGEGRLHEAWAGLRPGTPDDLPILGPTHMPGYFVATGHYRDGILLAPITAQVMAALILNEPLAYDLAPFSPQRFAR
ncbi:MAG: glycine oxidase ThiO [Acidobacteriales bacterium]|nr:glycine oxidase ThiO [Terriglobales bacterium]